MKCQYRVNKDLMLELEAANLKELYAKIAEAVEVYGNWGMCMKCKSVEFKPKPVIRLNKKKQKFYELHCTTPGCRARYAFGQNQENPTLFPQRKFPKSHPQAGEFKPNDGWVVFKKGEEDHEGGPEEAGTE